MRQHYIVSYDICDPTRLRKVHRIVRDFGDALQLSVFACQLGKKDLAVLEARLLEVLNQRQDQVVFTCLGPVRPNDERPPRTRALGRKLELGRTRVVVV